jgi:hypothetical protein
MSATPEVGITQQKRGPAGLPGWIIRTLGSMRLSVVLLLILAALTWLGTLAQVRRSLFDVQREYFESWFVMAKLPVALWGWEPMTRPLVIPLPGAYPVMGLLFVNLLVGGLLRMKWSQRNAGILITHIGIALLLVAGFVKMHYSYAGNMALFEAPTDGKQMGDRVTKSSTFVSYHDYELALLHDNGKTIEERVVAEAVLLGARGKGVVVLHADGLPFTIEVSHWLDNCDVMPKGPMFTPETPVVNGLFLSPQPPTDKREADTAGCYVTVVEESGQRQQGIVVGDERRPITDQRSPFTFKVQGQRYGLDLRRVLYDLPFSVRLDEFRKNDHPGTMMAKDFRSFVTVFEGGSERKVQIYMNTPLRKDGFVFYQASFGQAGMGGSDGSAVPYTVLEVARNPSDKWPEYACWVIALGMVVHFVGKLWKFLQSSTRKALQA